MPLKPKKQHGVNGHQDVTHIQSSPDPFLRCVFTSLPPDVCSRVMSYLRYLCLFSYSGVQYIFNCVFVFLHLVYHMLPVSQDYQFLIALSVFSKVYIHFKFQLLCECTKLSS